MSWDEGSSSWSTGLTKEHFDGEVVGKKVGAPDPSGAQPRAGGSDRNRRPAYADARWTDDELVKMRELEAANRWGKSFVDSWDTKMHETAMLMKQVRIRANLIVFVGVSVLVQLCVIGSHEIDFELYEFLRFS